MSLRYHWCEYYRKDCKNASDVKYFLVVTRIQFSEPEFSLSFQPVQTSCSFRDLNVLNGVISITTRKKDKVYCFDFNLKKQNNLLR